MGGGPSCKKLIEESKNFEIQLFPVYPCNLQYMILYDGDLPFAPVLFVNNRDFSFVCRLFKDKLLNNTTSLEGKVGDLLCGKPNKSLTVSNHIFEFEESSDQTTRLSLLLENRAFNKLEAYVKNLNNTDIKMPLIDENKTHYVLPSTAQKNKLLLKSTQFRYIYFMYQKLLRRVVLL